MIEEVESVNEKSMNAKTNIPFAWDPNTDQFTIKDSLKILEKINKEHGVPVNVLEKEIEIRTKLLIRLYQLNIFSPQQVSDIIKEYYKDPGAVIRRFRLLW